MGYYSTEGAQEATDFDSPVPNAQVAVQGSFLFVLEGAAAWFDLAKKMLVDALCTRGIGAKTRAGYGYFAEATGQEPRATCAWVDGKIDEFAAAPHAMAKEEALRGQRLAKAWAEIEDPDLKQAAWADIRARWEERGWWENPPWQGVTKSQTTIRPTRRLPERPGWAHRCCGVALGPFLRQHWQAGFSHTKMAHYPLCWTKKQFKG